jgi:hypothetical protein
MSDDDHLYHREREQHCRSMAEQAPDPDVRRRHHQLADLHAGRASQLGARNSGDARNAS